MCLQNTNSPRAYVIQNIAEWPCCPDASHLVSIQENFKIASNLHADRPIPWNQPLPYIEGLLFNGL